MVFTQSRGFVLGASFGLQCRSLRRRVLVCHVADANRNFRCLLSILRRIRKQIPRDLLARAANVYFVPQSPPQWLRVACHQVRPRSGCLVCTLFPRSPAGHANVGGQQSRLAKRSSRGIRRDK